MTTVPASNRDVAKTSNETVDYAQTVVATLTKDYAELASTITSQLDEARALTKVIETDDDLGVYGALIKKMRDTTKRLDSHHQAEKAPYLRGGQGVDQFFFGLWDKIAKRNKTSAAGAIDILDARIDDYMNRKRIAEEKRRKEEFDRQEAIRIAAERKAREEQRLADEKARQAEEAAAAAARARKPENVAAHQANADELQKETDRLDREAQESRAALQLAAQQAEDARIDAQAKAADMTRTRLDGGITATMKQEPYVEILDAALLNKELLWPHLREEHVLMALKAWAKTTGHKKPMVGAVIEMRSKGHIR